MIGVGITLNCNIADVTRIMTNIADLEGRGTHECLLFCIISVRGQRARHPPWKQVRGSSLRDAGNERPRPSTKNPSLLSLLSFPLPLESAS
jgi:hypothetical protein